VRQGLRAVAILASFFVLFAGCGGGNKVGSAFKNFKGQQAGQRIGESTPAPTVKAKAAATAAPVATVAPRQPVKTAAPQQSSLTIQITSSGFNPTAARVYQGSLITVTNTDAQPHSYTSSDGTYDTGMLAAHQSKTFTAGTAGSFQINDRSRNWIIGSLDVLHR
jgi:plastocyanin